MSVESGRRKNSKKVSPKAAVEKKSKARRRSDAPLVPDRSTSNYSLTYKTVRLNRIGLLKGDSARVCELKESIIQCAEHEFDVLIVGESGTGKGQVARLIHDLSRRSRSRFEVLSNEQVEEWLSTPRSPGVRVLTSDFTDAHISPLDLLAQFGEGTLFLEEIDKLSVQVQYKLRTVLDERILSHRRFCARMIFASSRDLSLVVEEGTFRSDLYYWMGPALINTPALRDRPEDIPVLFEHSLREKFPDLIKGDTPIENGALDLLATYAWPKNFWQLEWATTRLGLHLAREGIIGTKAVSELLLRLDPARRPLGEHGDLIWLPKHIMNVRPREILERYLDRIERKLIELALSESHTRYGCARRLGLSRYLLNTRLSRMKALPEAPSHELTTEIGSDIEAMIIELPEEAGQFWPGDDLLNYREGLAEIIIQECFKTLRDKALVAKRLAIPPRRVNQVLKKTRQSRRVCNG